LCGDPAPRREAGQKIAGTIKGCFGECGSETSDGNRGGLAASGFETGPTGGRFTSVAPTMDCRAKDGPIRNQLGVGAMIPAVVNTLTSKMQGSSGWAPYNETEHLIPAVAGTFTAGAHSCGNHSDSPYQGHLVPVAFNGNVARTLNARHDSSPCADRGMDVVAVPVYGFGGESDASSLSGAGNIQPPITCRHGAPGFVAHPVVPVAYDMTHGDDPMRPCGKRSPTLQGRMGTGGNQVPVIHASYAVRRLTVTECERLQGFPDGFTQVPYRNKPACDGPRYKALGNSMAVNCMQWLGLRIQKIDEVDIGKEQDHA
jgi:hypothetical protein